MATQKNIVLTGFMGTGKTTVGRILAERLGYQFVDTDVYIEEVSGQTIPEIFAEHGEPHFRALEEQAARALSGQTGTIVATGGGMMLSATIKDIFSPTSYIFCLTAPADEILHRVLSDEKTMERPLLKVDDPKAKIIQMLTDRAPLYGQYTQIDTLNKTAVQVADAILAAVSGSQ